MAYLRRSIATATGRTSDSPILTTPALGTPSAGVVTNLSGVLSGSVSGGTGLTAVPGGEVYLATVTGTDQTALSLDGYFTSAYTHYKYIYSITSATANRDIAIRYRASDADLTGAYYRYSLLAGYHDVNDSTATNNHSSDWNGTYMHIGSNDSAASTTHPCTGQLILYNALSTASIKTVTFQTNAYNSTSPTPNAIRNWSGSGFYYESSIAALTGLSFIHDGGNTTGTVSLYGIRNS